MYVSFKVCLFPNILGESRKLVKIRNQCSTRYRYLNTNRTFSVIKLLIRIRFVSDYIGPK